MHQLTPTEAKKLMEVALQMRRDNQTNHPKYAQILTLLKYYQQQHAAPTQSSIAGANPNGNIQGASLTGGVTNRVNVRDPPVSSGNPANNSSVENPTVVTANAPFISQQRANVTPAMVIGNGGSLGVATNPFMRNAVAMKRPMHNLSESPVLHFLFTEKQLEYLHNQIRSFKSLCRAMDEAIAADVSNKSHVLGDPNASLPKKINTELYTEARLNKKPSWTRASKNLLFLGPSCFDGNLIELNGIMNSGFGPYNISTPWLGMSDVTIREKYKKALEAFIGSRIQQLELTKESATSGESDANLLHKFKCLELQTKLRALVSNSHKKALAVMGEPVAVDRKSFRRRRATARADIHHEEREKRRKSLAVEKKRRADHQVYLRAILNHARDFFTYHKSMKANATKSARSVKAFIDQKVSKAEREEDRQEKLRLKALKANDMEAYSKLVAEAKNERLTYLLSQTNSYLHSIRKLIRSHKRKHDIADGKLDPNTNIDDDADESTEEGEDLDYLEIASKGELPRQPMMLVGGDLKEYQLRGLQWMVSLYDNHLNGILADEMGLGKTIQSISLLTYVTEIKHNHGPFLVVVPLSTLSNWVNEFKKWAPDLVLVVYKGPPQARKELYRQEMASCQFNVLLTTYEYIMKDKHVLRKYEWQYIIVDEGHRMKNAQSKFAMTLGTMYTSRNRLLLTGTPLQNSLPELWALLNFLLPTIFESVDTFEQWFSKPFSQFSGNGESNELSDEERMLIINRLHQVLRPFLLRRVKSSVLDQLPDKVERVLKCELSGWQKILYRRIQEGGALLMETTDADGQKKGKSKYTSKGLSNVLMQLRKVCNHPYLFQVNGYPIDFEIVRSSGKFELLDRMLPKLKAAGHRVLMFSQMTQLMHILEDYFNYRGFRYLRLDGSTSADEREQRMFMYNAPDSPYFIFLLSTRAGGLGLNLATADTVIIFDSDWNPAMDAQAQDRAHRIGQKNEVRVFRLVTNSPVEEKILSRATDKMNMNNLVVEAGKFNNRSKEAEPRAMLESLIKMEAEEAANAANGEDSSPVLEDDELNEMMALTDEELALYQRMDVERNDRENAEWEEYRKRMNLPTGTRNRLMSEKDVPEWLKEANENIDKEQAKLKLEQWNSDADHKRKRKEISYRDQLTDSEFVRLCETGIDENESTRSVQSKKKHDDHGIGKKRSRDSDSEALDESGRRTRKILCYFYRKIYDSVLKLKDSSGRYRAELYLEKPSAIDYPDYYGIIKNPMDLATIKQRIDKHTYSSHEDFEADFKLMISNAQLYNHPQALVYHDSIEIDKLVQSKLKKVKKKSMQALTEEYEVAKQQHRLKSKAKKEKKRAKIEQ